MSETERLFEELLDDAASGKRSPADCVALLEKTHPELVDELEMALILRTNGPDEAEIAAAREHAWPNIERLIDLAATVHTRYSGGPQPFAQARWHKVRWAQVALCAALLMLVVFGNWALSTATTNALPGSPLYSIKRADENLQLVCSLTDQARSQALARIAQNRLQEAHAEAALNHTGQALALIKDSTQATQQLIDLAVQLHQTNQDNITVTKALTTTLQAEYREMAQAQSHGQTWLTSALSTSLTNQQSSLVAGNVPVPPQTSPTLATPTVVGVPTADPDDDPTSSPDATATPTATPSPTPEPTKSGTPTPPHPTPGSGNGSGSGSGSGNGNGGGAGGHGGSHGNNGNENIAPTPEPDQAPTESGTSSDGQ